MAKDERIRNWTFVLYPESAPENWRDVLDELHIQWVESPLHDSDMNADDTQKKSHWHVLLIFSGKKSYDQVNEICEKLNATIPQPVQSAKGLVRYMAHLDNPEKHQYSPTDIRGHGGVDVAEYLKTTQAGRYALIKEMMQFVRQKRITEYMDLLDYAMEERYDDWFPLLCDNSTMVMQAYIGSMRNKTGKKKVAVDTDTGEVID